MNLFRLVSRHSLSVGWTPRIPIASVSSVMSSTRGFRGLSITRDRTDAWLAPMRAVLRRGRNGRSYDGHCGGESLAVGDAEVRVIATDGTLLVAPTLVLHYVTAHRYRPPDEFVEAVTNRRFSDR
jgi:hypothetical protein